MFQLSGIFASHALFQANSKLTFSGHTDGQGNVTATVTNAADQVFAQAMGAVAANGTFSLCLPTPAASFDPYTIRLSCGEDQLLMEDVLFGEVWLLAGQSNMELFNYFMIDSDRQVESMQNKTIRVLSVSYGDVPLDGNFPYDPQPSTAVYWITPKNKEQMRMISGAGIRFADVLYDKLNQNSNQVPIGIVNANWGATSIFSWLPRQDAFDDPIIHDAMERSGVLPTEENWNTCGGNNFKQSGACYNVKIAPLLGMQMRGVLWYQGENETLAEYDKRVYADALRFYQRKYAELFAVDPKRFLMISSLLFTWQYAESGECCLGYLNRAFVETSVESPDKFAVAPIGDLPPVWGYAYGNHPIHPTHKYAVGDRLALLALRNVYGEAGQKAPASLADYTVGEHEITLKFRNAGSGLAVSGRARGLYIAGEDKIYLPAEYRITSPDTMVVYNDEIAKPVHVAYGVISMETDINLFAGDLPVCPFNTDNLNRLSIEQRTWYDTSVPSRWVSNLHDDVLDMFYRPVWEADTATHSQLCPDRAFCFADSSSLRVFSDDSADFACFVRSYIYHRLNFADFSGLKFNMMGVNVTVQFVVVTASGETVLTPEKVMDHPCGWATYQISFATLPSEEIQRMEFRFHSDSAIHTAFIEHLRLFK